MGGSAMIRYTVLWGQSAENELASLWCDYPNRRDIAQAADQIDAELRENAHRKGLVLPHNLRTISSSPLTVYFRVSEADRKVFVEAVRLTETN
jgi:hypothetical protein